MWAGLILHDQPNASKWDENDNNIQNPVVRNRQADSEMVCCRGILSMMLVPKRPNWKLTNLLLSSLPYTHLHTMHCWKSKNLISKSDKLGRNASTKCLCLSVGAVLCPVACVSSSNNFMVHKASAYAFFPRLLRFAQPRQWDVLYWC